MPRPFFPPITPPPTTYDLNVNPGGRRQLKQQPVPGYDASQYVTERVWAPARDGRTRIPVTLVRHRDTPKDGSAPLLQFRLGPVKFPPGRPQGGGGSHREKRGNQHAGKPAEPIVKEGDAVQAGDTVGRVPDQELGASVHSSIAGVVREVTSEAVVIHG